MDFTTSGYVDVYNGNVNTLKNMLAQYPGKYHTMMSDIYAIVRCVQDPFNNTQYLSGHCQLDGLQYQCNSNR